MASNSISMQSNSISRYVVVVVVVIIILVCKQQARPHLYEHHNAQARSAHFVQAGTGSGAAGKWLAGGEASWASGLGRAHHVSQLLRKSGGAPLGCGEESKLASEQGHETGNRAPWASSR